MSEGLPPKTRLLAVYNRVDTDFFLHQQNFEFLPLVLELIEKFRALFDSDCFSYGSEQVATSTHVGFHLKVLIDCSIDGSVANIFFASFNVD